MRIPLFRKFSKGRLAWLLGLLLLMPVAQTAATWHLLSHIPARNAQRADQHLAALADYCDLCQTAAATMGGVLPTVTPVATSTAAPIHGPCSSSSPASPRRVWHPHASRAPPFALT